MECPRASHRSLSRPPFRGPHERGFTLIELTAVVVIISIVAALAIPQITTRLRDRKVHEAAQTVALLYQQARLRAMGEGGAVLIRFNGASQGAFETREALQPKVGSQVCGLMPSVSCTSTTTQWDTAGNYRSLGTVDLSKVSGYDSSIYAHLTPDVGTATSAMDVCFTPLGRSFVRYATTGAWSPMQGVPRFTVAREYTAGTTTGLTRKVLILPTGIARLEL